MREKLMNLLIKIDKIESHTEIKEEIGKLILELDYKENEEINITVAQEIKDTCCMPSICVSKCGDCGFALDLENASDIAQKKCVIS